MDEATLARNPVFAHFEHTRRRLLNRIYARLGGFSQPATVFVSDPDPRTIGSYAKGRQLMAGNFLFAGYLVEAPARSIWGINRPDDAFAAELHGFGWLDDLAAVGDVRARKLAQAWLVEWIDLYGRGKGAGWEPELAGRRVIRWINHALLLFKNLEKDSVERYYHSLGHQMRFLQKRWHAAPAGRARFEALTGLAYAGLALEGAGDLVAPAMQAIADECRERIDPKGGIPTRNPEELTEVFTLLNWAASALSEDGQMPNRQHLLAIERIAPTLRALRHSDGALARFHGGGRGAEGRLDQALAASGVRATKLDGLAMGYARLAAGRTSIVMDASAPPKRGYSQNAHASTLAFEMTSGRRSLVVSCGAGAEFGAEWRRAGRATPSHSTLVIHGFSSSLFAPAHAGSSAGDLLVDGPSEVRVQRSSGLDGTSVLATHNGYSPTHGLLHVRRLDLSLDGCELLGEDTLGALSEPDRITFEALMTHNGLRGVRFDVRFHLHPEVAVELDPDGAAVTLSLKSGEVWVFRHKGPAKIAVDASVYLETGRLKPRMTKQIVLSDTVLDYSSRVSWSFSRVQDGNRHVRDLESDDGLAVIR